MHTHITFMIIALTLTMIIIIPACGKAVGESCTL